MPFDYNEYQQKCNTLSTEQLHREWENYTRQISGGATSTATSVLFSPLTGGISLIGLGLSAPRIHNARKKREIIEAGLQARGSKHNTRKRDVIAPMAIAGTIGGLTLGLAGPGADMIAGEAVGKGVEYAMSHAALDGAGAAMEHKHDNHLKKKADKKGKAVQEQSPGMQVQPQVISYQVQTPLPGAQILHPTVQIQQPEQHFQTTQYQQSQTPVQDQKDIYGAVPPQHQITYQPALHQQSFSQPANSAQISNLQPASSYQYIQEPASQSGVPSPISVIIKPSENSYPPEKTPAFTTQASQQDGDCEFAYPAGCPTPLPLYSQLDKSQASSTTDGETRQELSSQEKVEDVSVTETTTVALTMEEEIMFLKAKLLQMEIEKREGTVPSIPESPLEIKEATPDVQTSNQSNGGPSSPPGHQQHPSLSVTVPTTHSQYAPHALLIGSPAASSVPPSQQHTSGSQAPQSPNPQSFPPPPPRSPHPQSNVPAPAQQPHAYSPVPVTPQPPQQSHNTPQTQQQQLYAPPSRTPQPQQQAYYPSQTQHQQYYPPASHTPQLQQQMYSQPPKSPQPQFQRNDSGYASMTSTPIFQCNPQQPYNPQQQYNPQQYVVSPQTTGNPILSPQSTGPAQQYGHERTTSYSSFSQPSPMSPAPPAYFPPPPGQQVVTSTGKDYINQRVSTPGPPSGQNIYQPAPMHGYEPQGTQGWQWGAPAAPAPVQGQPNYGPPPPIPRAYR